LSNLHNLVVVKSACLMINREYVVTLLLQPMGHRRAGALINQKLHLCMLHLERNERRIFEGFGGKKEACLDVFFH